MILFDPNPRSALEFLPPQQDLASLRAAAKDCRGCVLYREAAAQDLPGSDFRLTKHRGEVFPASIGPITATIHPSAILRMPEPDAKEAEIAGLVNDLRVAAAYAREHGR